jgi:Glutamate-cysteine ligase
MQIPKSRYDSVDLYLSESWMNRPEYNDNPLPIDQGLYDRMREHGELTYFSFFALFTRSVLQESMSFFRSILPTYLSVILLLFSPNCLTKMIAKAWTISRSASIWPLSRIYRTAY